MSELKIICAIVASESGREPSEITECVSFDSLDLDSLEFMNILLEVENALGVKIPEDAIPAINTVGDLAEFVALRA